MSDQHVPDDYYWYALYVKSRHEFSVLDRLSRAGIETFLPSVERLSRWKDRKKLIHYPLFPGYIFVHIRRVTSDIMTVLKTPGVVRFLGFEPRNPEVIPDEQIYSLKRLIESKEQIDPYPYIKEGQVVSVKKGPLTGATGILIKKEDRHFFVVSIDILKRSVAVKIDASDVEAVT
ncbi:MAG: UpxY family transcription antiterminator [Thermodesulfovibrionales bacterium]